MKKLFSTKYTAGTFNLATFLLRATLGFLMCLNHGAPKIANFSEMKLTFFDPFHIGHRWSLVLCIFAEVFASVLLILGVFTRIAALILFIDMFVAVFLFHRGQEVKDYEEAIVFLVGFGSVLLLGPGRLSVDAMTGK
jgi:putative oxidoreductase